MRQTTLEFLASLNERQREALLELACQGIRDELVDSFMRQNEILTIEDEELDDLLKGIYEFWEGYWDEDEIRNR